MLSDIEDTTIMLVIQHNSIFWWLGYGLSCNFAVLLRLLFVTEKIQYIKLYEFIRFGFASRNSAALCIGLMANTLWHTRGYAIMHSRSIFISLFPVFACIFWSFIRWYVLGFACDHQWCRGKMPNCTLKRK